MKFSEAQIEKVQNGYVVTFPTMPRSEYSDNRYIAPTLKDVLELLTVAMQKGWRP